MRRSALFIATAVLLGNTLPPQPAAATKPERGANGRYGGTVVIGIRADFDSFNELNASDADALQVINHMLFRRLTQLDAELQPVPDLAEKWHFSPDGRRLTFSLRRDVFWSDGVQTTAFDVAYTYKIATDPSYAYPAASRFTLVDSVVVADSFAVHFYLQHRYPDVLLDLQMPILPRHRLAHVSPEKIAAHPFNRRPVGNGPFILQEWQAKQKVVFTANPRYSPERPYLDRVIFVILPDEQILLNHLLSGEIDLIPALAPNQVQQVRSNKNLHVVPYPAFGYTFIAWNLRRPWLTKMVRRAFTMAIDRESIIRTLLSGFAQVLHGPILPQSWAFDPALQRLPFQPDSARALLGREGWRDSDGDGILDRGGRPLAFSLRTNAESRLRQDIAVMIQAQLREIGVAVRIDVREWNALLASLFERHDFDAVLLGWDGAISVDPAPLWHSRAIENGYNFIGYRNPQIDDLIERGRRATTREEAIPIWASFQQQIARECPYTFLFVKQNIAAIGSRLRGTAFDARGFLGSIQHWWIPESLRRSSRQ